MTQALLPEQIPSSSAVGWEREEQFSVLDQFGGNTSATRFWVLQSNIALKTQAAEWPHVSAIYLPTAKRGSHFLGSNVIQQKLDRMVEEREAEITELRTLYVFEEPSLVINFLRLHRSVSSLLVEAVPFLRRSFDGNPVLRLRVVCEEGSLGTIYGLVEWKGALEAARKALRTFDEDWWIAASSKASGKVMFDYQLA